MTRAAGLAAAGVCFCFWCAPANAVTTLFFDSAQFATLVSADVTSDTISSDGYLFIYSRDKLFTGGTGQVIGRPVRIPWPDGVEAQAVTTPPPGVTDHKARMTLQRVDGQVFDMTAFTVKLLANTGGAGAALEIMPLVNGEDAFADPIAFDVTGYYGQTFLYDTSPNPWGSTALLTGYDTYKISLYVDFAMVGLTLNSAAIAGDFDQDGDVDATDFGVIADCLGGPDVPGGCAPQQAGQADLGGDGDVDLMDVAAFQRAFTG